MTLRRRQSAGFVVTILALSLLACAASPRVEAQITVVIEPTMVRGAMAAPVTIVEFSDYQ
jgi:hypothetical protein